MKYGYWNIYIKRIFFIYVFKIEVFIIGFIVGNINIYGNGVFNVSKYVIIFF